MRSVLGPLLLGFLPLVAVGCALPERFSNRAESLGFRPKSSAPPKVTTDPPSIDDFWVKKSAQNRQDLKVAESSVRDRKTESRTEPDSSLSPGHSSDVVNVSDTSAWPPKKGTVTTASNVDSESIDRSSPTRSTHRESTPDAKDRSWDNRRDEEHSLSAAENPLPTGRDNDLVAANSDAKPAPTNRRKALNFRGDETAESTTKGNTADANSVPLWSTRSTDGSNIKPVVASEPDKAKSTSARSSGPMETTAAHSKLDAAGNGSPPSWQVELEQLIARMEQELGQAKGDQESAPSDQLLKKQVHLRLLYLMAQRQEDAMTAIPGADSAQQEFWQQMIWAMSNSFDTKQFPNPAERAAQTVPPLSAALRQMREQADLSIKNMTFCRKISYFGNYERFPRNVFTAGHEVLLYTEIENFVSVPTAEGEYRTSLKSLMEIFDAQGKIVWTKGFASTTDFCRNPRRDYFHNYQFYIPEDLSTGTYTLKLTIVDELSKKRSSNSLNFVLK
jgi:hypothetical protein